LQAAAVWLTRGGGFAHVADEKTELAVTDSANIGLGPANAAAQTGMCTLSAMYNLNLI
jgi:hypothetical protein